MKIGALAQQFDVTVDTIRFYEKQGLISIGKNTNLMPNFLN